MIQSWDEASQSFSKDGILQTSVYRPYPGSKSKEAVEDGDITTINQNVTSMFLAAQTPADLRQNYRMIGAVWIKHPDATFLDNKSFAIAQGASTDDGTSILAGEGRLGSTAMESFTEFEGGAPNCFSCHDTRAIKHSKPDMPNVFEKLLPPAKLNVTHILSKFIYEHPSQG